MRLIACQFTPVWEDRAASFDRVRQLLDAAASPIPAGSMILLPEMFSTGFSMDVEKIAEPEPSPTPAERFLGSLAAQTRSWTLGGLVRRLPNGKGANELAVFDPFGQPAGRYRKIHTFSFAGESEHYESGRESLIFEAGGFNVCPFICYDLRFPERFRDAALHRGATLFPVLANWPTPRVEHWRTLLAARAIENQAFVAGVNRCGSDPKVDYPGQSRIVGPRGELLAEGGPAPAIVTCDISPDAVDSWRSEFPALRDAKR